MLYEYYLSQRFHREFDQTDVESTTDKKKKKKIWGLDWREIYTDH